MSVSQAVLAFFNPEPRPAEGRKAASGADGDFAKVLADQNTEQLDAYLDGLEQGAVTMPGDPMLAEGGKALPDPMKQWLGQLSFIGHEDKSAAADTAMLTEASHAAVASVSEGWMQWLKEARLSLGEGQPQAGSAEQSDTALPSLTDETGLAPLRQADLAISDAALAMRQAGRADASAPNPAEGQKDKLALVTDTADEQGKGRQLANDAQLQNAPVQRATSVAMAADMQAAFAGKLAEQVDGNGVAASSESESLDDIGRPGTTAQNTAQAALTARPVNGAAQSLGVPFGHQTWGEAMVQKVMWASSQNLRSVEIMLDPAELGPLEIQIQQRGQEHTVQFVSQNPSVREALESQMYRLREMFSQQGMEQVNVTVADRSDGQSGQAQSGLAGEGQRSGGQGRAGSEQDQGETLVTTAAAAQVSSDRLVDYYA